MARRTTFERPAADGQRYILLIRSVIRDEEVEVAADVLPRVGSGDPGAAEELMDRYGGLVWSLARRHTRTASDAEDAVQEIFLALWKNAERFDSARASEAAFVTMIARRRLIDLHRHKERRPPTEGSGADLETLIDLGADRIELEAEANLAARVVGHLKPREREVILLATYHGMSHSEIASYVDMPLGTVKTYIRRGLMQVREALENPDRASARSVAT